jgi:long-chain acyl-CoA synthetase
VRQSTVKEFTVREFSVPALVTPSADASLASIPFLRADRDPLAVLLSRRIDGGWQDVTAGRFAAEVTALAKGLIAAGVQPGERVGLMSRTRYEWTLFDFALWAAGAVSVPVYETSSPEQLRWIMSDSGAKHLVVESAEHERLVETVRDELPELGKVWRIEDGAVAKLTDAGASVPDQRVTERREALTAASIATLIYTSGTTGRPKGVVLTHGNFLAECHNAITLEAHLFERQAAATLLLLPLAHVLARMVQVAALLAGCRIGHAPDTRELPADLVAFRPTFLVCVPRVFQKVYNNAELTARGAGRGRIFAQAAETAIAYSKALEQGRVGAGLRLRHALFDQLVYGRLRAALGGRCEYAISGGAPLGDRLGHFFRGVGVEVLEGYGLTETTAAAAVNAPSANRIGTVGLPLPGGAAQIAEDGEVLLRGDYVCVGYWDGQRPVPAVDEQGWFHTGDLGQLDEDGFLRITDRKKEIIVTAGGKNVAPAVLEERLAAHPLIAQALVVGDQRPFIAALITLDMEMLRAWRRQRGQSEDVDLTEMAADPDVLASVGSAIDEANSTVSRAESIRKFAVLDREWSEAGGQITPSLKLKRRVVLREHAADVDKLYDS